MLNAFSVLSFFKFTVLGTFLTLVSLSVSADYTQHPKAKAFVDNMVSKHGFDRSYMNELLRAAKFRNNIIESMERPAEKVETWGEYREKRLSQWRIDKGLEFYRANEATLKKAQETYQVDASVITAIIGVETNYGRFMGSERVLDAMATIAFDYDKRSKEFTRYFEDYLLLTREKGLDPLVLKGSYAGALGYGQFMPGSYRRYAVDFDGDGKVDIINNVVDAIGSVANYIKEHGWVPGETAVTKATVNTGFDEAILTRSARRLNPLPSEQIKAKNIVPLAEPIPAGDTIVFRLTARDGKEYWLGHKNLVVITKYNYSFKYAMLVNDLSETIKSKL